ncbi:hypothetical protein [Halopenitus persicus]|uniref:hypothetical protein n=1 Tax=Halopenitus persicus TaxID=1048396 RepID=UPI000BBA6FA9|nr:hypothetical protein [Halopenitus persicus]
MSGSDSGPGTREVAYRLFASEFDDATLSYSESDEERAPNYVLTPLGARVNRLFAVGVLTEVERVNEETRRGRVVDPSGAFVTYAGQYQPDEQAFLERADPPTFVALTGKARTFQPEDSDRVFTSVRPESLNEVDADTRDRWVVRAAETTLDRLATFDAALVSDLRGEDLRTALEAGGAPTALAEGIPRAIDHYGTSRAYLEATRRMAIDALELIAGERDDVRVPEIAPDGGGPADVGPLPETDVSIDATAVHEAAASGAEDDERVETDAPTGDERVETDAPAGDDEGTAAEPVTEPSSDDGTDADERATESVATTDDTPDANEAADRLGDFDAEGGAADETTGTVEDSDAESTDVESADADPTDPDGMYELDEEERAEIEDEFGTDFSTGTEVDDPGSADIDVPSADDLAADDGAGAAASDDGAGSETASDVDLGEPVGSTDTGGSKGDTTADLGSDAATGGDDAAGDGESDAPTADADLDLTGAAIEAMDDLDDGDGAARQAVIDAVVEELGADPDAVADAIDDALMSGKCYEPSDDRLKAI